MFRFVLIILALCCAPLAQAKDLFPEGARVYALVVGVSDFRHLDVDQDLLYAEADAVLFRQTLIERSGGAIQEEDVRMLIGDQASLPAVERALASVLSEADEDDLVVLYFSTHGFIDNEEGHLMTWDTVPARRGQTSLKMVDLEENIDRSEARHVLLFLDACNSGIAGVAGSKAAPEPAGGAVLDSIARAEGSLFMFSSSLAFQRSLEGPDYCEGHGAFTCSVTRVMSGESGGDINGDGLISLMELAGRVPGEVLAMTGGKQLPEYKGQYDGAMAISQVNPAAVRQVAREPLLQPGTRERFSAESRSVTSTRWQNAAIVSASVGAAGVLIAWGTQAGYGGDDPHQYGTSLSGEGTGVRVLNCIGLTMAVLLPASAGMALASTVTW